MNDKCAAGFIIARFSAYVLWGVFAGLLGNVVLKRVDTAWLAERLRRQIPRQSRWLRLLSGAILGIFGIRLLLMSGIPGQSL